MPNVAPPPANHPAAQTPRRARWSELDSLRFFAVLGVMFVHFSPNGLGALGEWGTWGVTFFFVLSGFLITDLLLVARRRVEAGESRVGFEIRHFFLRRILRLWPIYYLVLFVTAAIGIRYGRPMLPWNMTFLSNYYVIRTQNWPELFSHLWTLAIEQQFYTVWPWLILGLPRKWLPPLFAGLIVGAAAYRAGAARLGLASPFGVDISLPACGDFFAWGAALAWWRLKVGRWTRTCGRRALAAALLGASVLLATFALRLQIAEPHLRSGWTGAICSISAAALILHCLSEDDSALRSLLRWRPLVYLGSISYGIYLLHNFSHWIAPRILRRLIGRNYFAHETPHVLYLIALSIAMAALSWRFIEQPINRIRTRI